MNRTLQFITTLESMHRVAIAGTNCVTEYEGREYLVSCVEGSQRRDGLCSVKVVLRHKEPRIIRGEVYNALYRSLFTYQSVDINEILKHAKGSKAYGRFNKTI